MFDKVNSQVGNSNRTIGEKAKRRKRFAKRAEFWWKVIRRRVSLGPEFKSVMLFAQGQRHWASVGFYYCRSHLCEGTSDCRKSTTTCQLVSKTCVDFYRSNFRSSPHVPYCLVLRAKLFLVPFRWTLTLVYCYFYDAVNELGRFEWWSELDFPMGGSVRKKSRSFYEFILKFPNSPERDLGIKENPSLIE